MSNRPPLIISEEGVRNMMAQAAERDLDGPWDAVQSALGVLDPEQAILLIERLHDVLRERGNDPDRSL